jgi:hypothetical protein
MGFGHPVRSHFVKNDGNSGIGDLPGRFRAGKAGADDMHAPRWRWEACHEAQR